VTAPAMIGDQGVNKKRSAMFLGSVIAISLLLTLVLLLLAAQPSNRVVWQDCQPQTIAYGSFDPYCLSVVEGSRDWGGLPFSVTRRYFLFIGRGTDAPSYGHYLDFTFTFDGDDPDAFIKASKADWTPDGITFRAKTGHALFIPKSAYIGGR
jgi:hypothetical protein